MFRVATEQKENTERKKNTRPEIAILLCRDVGKYLPVRLALFVSLRSFPLFN